MEKKLCDFKIGEKGKIKYIWGSKDIKRRMLDMGLVVGVEVELKRVAPLGDPIEIYLKGYNLAIRRFEGSKIIMEV